MNLSVRLTKPISLKGLIVSIACGVALACAMLVIGLLHNVQVEFYSTDDPIDYQYALGLFGIWFLVGVFGSLLLGVLFKRIYKLFVQHTS
jgi:ammonia channel protein AmtB